MTLDISIQPMRVLIDGHDSKGRLILVDNQLAAVIVRVDGESHSPENRGCWHLEAGFGKCADTHPPLFLTPDEAGEWVRRRINLPYGTPQRRNVPS